MWYVENWRLRSVIPPPLHTYTHTCRKAANWGSTAPGRVMGRRAASLLNPPYTRSSFQSMTESPGSRWPDLPCRSTRDVINNSHNLLLGWNRIRDHRREQQPPSRLSIIIQVISNACTWSVTMSFSFSNPSLKYHSGVLETMEGPIIRLLLRERGNESTERPVEADGLICGNNFSHEGTLRWRGVACKRVRGCTYINTTSTC